MSKIALLAKLTAKEGMRDDLLAVIADLGIRNVNGEPGTEIYAAHADKGDDNVVWFYELYSDGDALAAHGGSDAMKEFGKATGAFMAERPEIIMLDPHCAKGLDL